MSDISEENAAAFEALFVMIGLRRTCADLLFSGHAAFYTLGFLLVWTYDLGEQWMWLFGWEKDMKRQATHMKAERERLLTTGAAASSSFQSSAGDEESQVVSIQTRSATPAPLPGSPRDESTPPLLLTDQQIRQEAHDELADQHPWVIPELNAAGDPSQS